MTSCKWLRVAGLLALLTSANDPLKAKCVSNEDFRRQGDTLPPDAVQIARLSPDSSSVSAVLVDGSVVSWDLATGAKTIIFECIPSAVRSMEFSPDGHELAIGDGEGVVHILSNVSPGSEVILRAASDTIEALAFATKGDLLAVAANGDSQIQVWNIAYRALVTRFSACDRPGQSLAFSAQSNLVAAICGERWVKIWSLKTAAPAFEFDLGSSDYGNTLAFTSDDAAILVGTGKGHILVFGLPDEKLLRTLSSGTEQVIYMRTLGIDGFVSVSDDGSVHFWSTNRDKPLRALRALPGEVSRDGTLLLVQPDNIKLNILQVWSLNTDKLVRELH